MCDSESNFEEVFKSDFDDEIDSDEWMPESISLHKWFLFCVPVITLLVFFHVFLLRRKFLLFIYF